MKALPFIVIAASLCLATDLIAQDRSGRGEKLGEIETQVAWYSSRNLEN